MLIGSLSAGLLGLLAVIGALVDVAFSGSLFLLLIGVFIGAVVFVAQVAKQDGNKAYKLRFTRSYEKVR